MRGAGGPGASDAFLLTGLNQEWNVRNWWTGGSVLGGIAGSPTLYLNRTAKLAPRHNPASNAGVGQPSTGRPSRICSCRTASRVLVPTMPSMPPTS